MGKSKYGEHEHIWIDVTDIFVENGSISVVRCSRCSKPKVIKEGEDWLDEEH